MAKRTARSDRFHVPARAAVDRSQPTMIRRPDPVFVERVEAGPWRTLSTDMVREVRVTFSSGARMEIAARYEFTEKERRALMESMALGDVALSHRFLEKRAFAMQTVLGEVQRKYGPIPPLVTVE